jgi:hypothetical protein
VTERAFWSRYMAAYQDIIRHTSTRDAPWHVVPADHKWFARVVIGSVIVSALEALNLRYPRVGSASKAEFAKVRKALADERDIEEARRRRPVKKPVSKNLGKGKKTRPKGGSKGRNSTGLSASDDAA